MGTGNIVQMQSNALRAPSIYIFEQCSQCSVSSQYICHTACPRFVEWTHHNSKQAGGAILANSNDRHDDRQSYQLIDCHSTDKQNPK